MPHWIPGPGDSRTPTHCENFRAQVQPQQVPCPPPGQALPTFQVAALRLRVRPRLVRVLFMRKEKHRSVGASGFFLDRPEEGRGRGGEEQVTGQLGTGPSPSSTLVTNLSPASSPKLRLPTQRGSPRGMLCSFRPPGCSHVPVFPWGRATSSSSHFSQSSISEGEKIC